MSAPEPSANPLLVGHAAAEAEFLGAARAGRLHHAWLLTGPAGIGKATAAYRFARWLLAGSPPGKDAAVDPAHPVFRRIAAGGHADLKTLTLAVNPDTGKLRREIVVADVRTSTAFLHRTAIEGGWRVMIVDPADALNRNAENALLKIVEEPPARAVIFLVAAAPGRLSATLRSRCRRLRFDPLTDDDMERLLARYLPETPEEERARLGRLAEGSPGRALQLAAKEGASVARLVDEALAAVPHLDRGKAYSIADRLGRDEAAFGVFMELLEGALANAVRAAARGTASAAETRFLGHRPLAAWGSVWQAIRDLAVETERLNLEKRQALVAGLTELNGR